MLTFASRLRWWVYDWDLVWTESVNVVLITTNPTTKSSFRIICDGIVLRGETCRASEGQAAIKSMTKNRGSIRMVILHRGSKPLELKEKGLTLIVMGCLLELLLINFSILGGS